MKITHELLDSQIAYDSGIDLNINGLLKIETFEKTKLFLANFEFISNKSQNFAWIEMKESTFIKMITEFKEISVQLIELSLNAQFKQFEYTTFKIIKN